MLHIAEVLTHTLLNALKRDRGMDLEDYGDLHTISDGLPSGYIIELSGLRLERILGHQTEILRGSLNA